MGKDPLSKGHPSWDPDDRKEHTTGMSVVKVPRTKACFLTWELRLLSAADPHSHQNPYVHDLSRQEMPRGGQWCHNCPFWVLRKFNRWLEWTDFRKHTPES